MAETIDTYFDAWNASDAAERRTLIECCLTTDVELIDENGRFSGHDGLAALMAKFHQNVPGGRIVRTSGFDEFEGITRYSWMLLTPRATPRRPVSTLLKRARTVGCSASSCSTVRSRPSAKQRPLAGRLHSWS